MLSLITPQVSYHQVFVRFWRSLTELGGTAILSFGTKRPVACGWLKNRWGVYWQVTPTRPMELIKDPDQNRARRAMEAMVKMIKIDIAEVERAANSA
jgi:predicted 3-demethylubiquinone-9 3-methyltransferase (glyoxalase superfamily)